jgi:phosphoribosylaminoimidazolecarboxamide formyltransferase/IMP cyclohydrolase
MLPVRRALVSVFDKAGLGELGSGLVDLGVEIISTGGTARQLGEHGVDVTTVSDVTGHPEILHGRVKSLHPRIFGGILADRRRPEHRGELERHEIPPIDLVAVNLYAFAAAASSPDATVDSTVEMIDIGGPSMVRAAAKNFANVAVVVDPSDYPRILEALRTEGGLSEELRRELALKAFRHTQSYDAAIADWLEGGAARTADEEPGSLPRSVRLELEQVLAPRYGENPHQGAAVYRETGGGGVLGGFRQLQGRELSWNNMLDADAARKLSALFGAPDDDPAVVIVKHNNPCGVGRGGSLVEAYERALACDPVSAFGSIVAVNRPFTGALAEALAKLFVEVIVAPSFAPDALERLGRKKNLRLLECPPFAAVNGAYELRAVDGGFIAQHLDAAPEDPGEWTCPTHTRPDEAQLQALDFAWRVCRATKSNAIVVTNEHQTVGIGAGQMSRVDSCRIALDKAQLDVAGTVAASDAFFPFRDGVDTLAEAGVAAIVQPGGSVRDDEVIAAADERGIAMLLTGRRHFKH